MATTKQIAGCQDDVDRAYTAEEKGHISPDSVSDDADTIARDYGVSETKLLQKLDLHLLPGVCILYLLSFLDRSNVANARLDGLATDLGITGNEYLTGLTLFFLGYILFEIVWNVILKRIGPKIWLPLVTFIWGIVATLQGVIVNNGGKSGLAGFFVVRFMLGVTEGISHLGGLRVDGLLTLTLCRRTFPR
jgi:MFS family permease